MKKKILAILLVVSMVAALAVGLTACNKDKKTAPAKANNAETLGTARGRDELFGSGHCFGGRR